MSRSSVCHLAYLVTERDESSPESAFDEYLAGALGGGFLSLCVAVCVFESAIHNDELFTPPVIHSV